MTVYVDDMHATEMGRYGRLKMSHMISDTEEELHAMADRIGVARRWFQGDHYDIAMTKRALAVQFGAVEVAMRDMALMSYDRRRDPKAPLLTPAAGRFKIAQAIATHVRTRK